MKKICKTCKQEKELDEFPWQDKKKGLKRAHCTECYNSKRRKDRQENLDHSRELNRLSYEKHKEARIEGVKRYRSENPEKVKQWSKNFTTKIQTEWIEWKSTLSCSTCGENDPSCLEFHHIDPSEKEGLISKLRFSRRKLEKELEKCIVLCSNCHRKLHNSINKDNHV